MSMNGILEQIQTFNINDAMSALEETGHVLTQTETAVLAVLCAAGVLFCLFGLKTVRFWAGLFGLLLGFTGGTAAAYYLGMNESYIWIPGAVLGVILAVLGVWRYRFGVFLTVWTVVSLACVYLMRPADWIWGAVCMAAGLVLGLLASRFVAFLTMLSTAACGAILSGSAACYLLSMQSMVVHAIICVVLGIIGFLVQLLLESRKRKKQNLKKAAEIREHHSTANEVEKARALVDELEQGEEKEAEESEELEFIQFDDEDEETEDIEESAPLDEDEEPDHLDEDEELDYLDDEEIDYLDDEEDEEIEEKKEK